MNLQSKLICLAMPGNSLLRSIKLKPPNTLGKYFSHSEKRTSLEITWLPDTFFLFSAGWLAAVAEYLWDSS
jgi:hypothetical protein